MSVEVERDVLRLIGDCEVADAEALATWLSARPSACVDVTEAGWLHTAVVQAMLVFGATIVGRPKDAFLARWLVPTLLAGTRTRGEI